jgi:vancomycin resistance protein YoaR
MVQRGRANGARVTRLGLAVAVCLGALVVLTIAASALEHVVYSGHVLPGVAVDGVHVAGHKDVDAADAITRLAADLDRTPIRVSARGQQTTLAPSLIGFDVDVDATLARARADGRSGNPVALVAGTLMRRVRSDHVDLVVNYDHARVEGLLDGWENAYDHGVVEGALRFQGTTVVPVEPRAGVGVQRDEARRRLVAALTSADRRTTLVLPIGPVEPHVSAASVAATAARARALLTGTHEIHAGTNSVTLTAAQLASTLVTRIDGNRLDLTVDPARLRLALGAAVGQFERPAVDAGFDVGSTNTVSVVPSRDGLELDLGAVAADLTRDVRVIDGRLHPVHPRHDTAWAKRLGITEQVSSFTTYHSAGQPRVHNIHLAADVLNNTVVEPGQVFSLNEKLGPRTPEKGYVKAPILVEDGFGEDYGGGISQLTTTLFNAVFFGGYEDLDHSPHHFYISRYPMGREATINYPSVDLKFRNDTTHGVLIRTSYSATAIAVTFYGDNDGRTVREENRQIVHTEPITDGLVTCPVKKPEDDPHNDCAHLTALERKTLQSGETGYDVQFDRVIDQPGKPERRTHYRVHYPMLPNKVLVGTAPPSTTTAAEATTTTKKTTRSTLRHP